MPTRIVELKHPPSQHTLQTTTRARGAMPSVVPMTNREQSGVKDGGAGDHGAGVRPACKETMQDGVVSIQHFGYWTECGDSTNLRTGYDEGRRQQREGSVQS